MLILVIAVFGFRGIRSKGHTDRPRSSVRLLSPQALTSQDFHLFHFSGEYCLLRIRLLLVMLDQTVPLACRRRCALRLRAREGQTEGVRPSPPRAVTCFIQLRTRLPLI